jgi:hypothetical protein
MIIVWTSDTNYQANRSPILSSDVSTSWGNEYKIDGKMNAHLII